MSAVNQVLAPTIQLVNELAANASIANFDFWQLINWIFVTQYWVTLLDFGQLSPTTLSYSAAGVPSASANLTYNSTYNIFVNETLFEIYHAYLNNVILPLFDYQFAQFLPLNDTNKLEETNVSLEILYSCSDLQLKSPADLIISVLVADWAFISTFYALILFAGRWLEKGKTHG